MANLLSLFFIQILNSDVLLIHVAKLLLELLDLRMMVGKTIVQVLVDDLQMIWFDLTHWTIVKFIWGVCVNLTGAFQDWLSVEYLDAVPVWDALAEELLVSTDLSLLGNILNLLL